MKIWRINYYRMIVASIILIFHFSTSILFSQQDSHNSEFKKFDSYFSSSYNQIPSKLAIKICNLDLKNIYPNTEIYTSEKFQINNSKYSAYIIDVYMHPCNEYVVYVFSSIGNISDQLDLLWSCDHELSDPSYTYEEYKIINNSIIELKSIESFVKDSTLIDANGQLKDIDFFQADIKEKVMYTYFKINSEGKISELSNNLKIKEYKILPESSCRLLRKNELTNYTPKELRLMRNEIFADHGYIFKSEDLRNFFLEKDWYKPRFDNVNDSLNDIEKINISLIKSLEVE